QAGSGGAPPCPFDGPRQDTHRTGADRLAAQEAVEVLGKGQCGRGAASDFLAQALEADRFQVARATRHQLTRRDRFCRTTIEMSGLNAIEMSSLRPARRIYVYRVQRRRPDCYEPTGA